MPLSLYRHCLSTECKVTFFASDLNTLNLYKNREICIHCQRGKFEPFKEWQPLMNNGSFIDREVELLRKISQGDEEAFNVLYQLTHKKVYSYLYRLLQGRSMVEDVLVETYAEVWRGAQKFKGYSRAVTWILGIARNLAMNELRKLKYHEDIDDFLELSNGKEPDAEVSDRRELLNKAMASLSIKQREVLDLVFFQEMNYREVSEILHIPVNTVKTRVFYAKELLRGALKAMGVDRDVV
jgi:RNA polymerase sigma-70 factor, ECF subfamily